jgi:hypothetical protein
MDREEKLRQIVSGFFHFKYNGKIYKYIEPVNSFYSEISFHVRDLDSELKRSGFLTEEDEKRILIERGLWSEEKEKELDQCKIDIDKLRTEKPRYKFQSKHLKVIESTIDTLDNKIKELEEVRGSMYSNTIEYQRLYRINVLLLSQSVRNLDGSKVWSSIEDLEKDFGISESDLMLRAIGGFNRFSTKDIRDIAKNEPWRTIWRTSTKTGTPLFSKPLSEMTKSQYELCYWSNVYDSVYESPDYPGQDVVEDDEALDEWFIEQNKKYNNGGSKKTNKPTNSKIANASEVFVKVDTPEDAQKVYEEMNNDSAKRIIQRRSKIIEEKGHVAEDQLPDVNEGLQMAINSMGLKNK